MLRERIISVDFSKKNTLISDEAFYQKRKLIGQGTFGKVYSVKSIRDGQLYAMKQVMQDRRYKNRELGIISRVQHCNIIGMKQHFIKMIGPDHYLSLIMEILPTNLNEVIRQHRKTKQPFLSITRKLIAFQLFKALYYMELTNICHRDLKPSNILLNDKTFEVKICDFGSAKIFDHKQKNVTYICSRYYRAPELVLEDNTYGTEIDMWSIGCIIAELLTLQPLFPGDCSQQQLIEFIKILGTPPQSLLDLYEQTKKTAYHLPQIKGRPWETVLHKYKPEQNLIDLISKILKYDHKGRLRPLDALKHPYFQDLPQQHERAKHINHIFYFADLQNASNYKQVEELQRLYPQWQPELKQKKTATSLHDSVKFGATPNTANE